MFKEIIILILVIYLLSRVVRFLLPIFRIGSMASHHIRKMQQQMNDMESGMNKSGNGRNTPKQGDYIDYEEVK